MTKPNWKKLQLVFEKTLSTPESKRKEYIESACTDDIELFNAVNKLLRADARNAASQNDQYAIKISDLDSKLIGETIDGWNIKEQIGVGGMGSVFLAEKNTEDFQHQVALKIVKKGMDSESVINRFRQERKILASLNHPNIARLIDGGVTDDGRPYFVMDLVKGLPITEYCDSKKLGIFERLSIFQKVCNAVHYAHKNLIVHRDLKPSNIIVTEEGELKLLDFGIAKLLNDSEDFKLTQVGMQVHTPAYASPEQLTGDSITTASDIYTLGILLYEILSGRRPFEIYRSKKEYIELILSKEPMKPSDALLEISSVDESTKTIEDISIQRNERVGKLQRTLSGDLDVICLTAMHRESERRYTSSSDLAADINRHIRGLPVQAQVDSTYYRFKKFLGRNIAASMISIVAFVTIISLSVFYTMQLTKQRDIAILEREKSEQIVDFVTGLFEISDPSESKGENISARDLLDAGFIQIQTKLSDQPIVQQTLRRVLGEVYYKMGLEKQAKEILTETLSKQKLLLGDSHLDVAITKIILGFIYQDRGKLDLAESLFIEAFNTQKQLLKSDHFVLVESLNVLAFLEQTKGDYEKSESLFIDALNMAKRLSKGDHEYVAETLKNLGGVNRVLDRNDKAELLLREALSMQMRLYEGGIHPEIDDTKRELAGLLRNTRRFNEAKKLYEEVIASRTKNLGNEHIEVANVWNSYSNLLADMGENEKAIVANKTFMDILFLAYPGPHPSLGAAYNNRAHLFKTNKDYEKAIKYFNLAIEMQNATGLPEKHSNRTYPLGGMGIVYLEQKKYLEAKILFNQVLTLRKRVFSDSHKSVGDAKSNLASALTGLKEYEEAERLLVECYNQFIRTRGADDPRTERAARRLLYLYKKTSAKNKALALELLLKESGVHL